LPGWLSSWRSGCLFKSQHFLWTLGEEVHISRAVPTMVIVVSAMNSPPTHMCR
jgi:hypothetical protein